jgi:hypothetical protein
MSDSSVHVQLEQGSLLRCCLCSQCGSVVEKWVSRAKIEVEPDNWQEYSLPTGWSVAIHADKEGVLDANVFYCPEHQKTLYAVAFEVWTSAVKARADIDYTHARSAHEAAQKVGVGYPIGFRLVSSAKAIGLFGDESGKRLFT